MDLQTVPVLFRGIWDEEGMRHAYQPTYGKDPMEGFVVRLAGKFPYGRFRSSVAKYVRTHHVQTSKNWMYQQTVKNNLEKTNDLL